MKLAFAIFLIVSLQCAVGQHTYSLYVSADDGNDDEGCGTQDHPCKSIGEAITVFNDTIGQYYINLAPGLYAGASNSHLKYSGVSVVILQRDPDNDGPGNVVIDCTEASPDVTTACFEHSSSLALLSVYVTGRVNNPVIRSLPGASACRLKRSYLQHINVGNNPQKGDREYLAVIDAGAGSGSRTTLSSVEVYQVNLPFALLSNNHAMDITKSNFSDCTVTDPYPMIEMDNGPDGLHALNFGKNYFAKLKGFASLVRYNPTAQRGTFAMSDVEIENCEVTDAIIHFEGASLLGDDVYFRDNKGLWSVRMIQHATKLGERMEISWLRGGVLNSPPIELEDAAGWFRDVRFSGEGAAPYATPMLTVRNPVNLVVTEVLLEEFKRAPDADVDAPLFLVEASATSYDVVHMNCTIKSSAARNNQYLPVAIRTTDTRGTLFVTLEQGVYANNTNAGGHGGAVAIQQAVEAAAVKVTFDDVVFRGNEAEQGGAVFCTAMPLVAAVNVPSMSFRGASLAFIDNEAEKGASVYTTPGSKCAYKCQEEVEYLCEGLDDGTVTVTTALEGDADVNGFVVASLVVGFLVVVSVSFFSSFMAVWVFLKMKRLADRGGV